MSQRQVLVLQPLQVAQHVRFGAISAEDGMAQKIAAALKVFRQRRPVLVQFKIQVAHHGSCLVAREGCQKLLDMLASGFLIDTHSDHAIAGTPQVDARIQSALIDGCGLVFGQAGLAESILQPFNEKGYGTLFGRLQSLSMYRYFEVLGHGANTTLGGILGYQSPTWAEFDGRLAYN